MGGQEKCIVLPINIIKSVYKVASYVTAIDNVRVYKCRNGNFQLWLVVSKQDDEQFQIL